MLLDNDTVIDHVAVTDGAVVVCWIFDAIKDFIPFSYQRYLSSHLCFLFLYVCVLFSK